jgi:uncharacterized protein with LGFP repeats
MYRSTLLLLSVYLLLLFAACRGEAGLADLEEVGTADQSVTVVGRTAFPESFGAYPRLVRLEAHPTAKGALIGTFEATASVGAVFYRSDDDGRSWRYLSQVTDTSRTRVCCSTLYELPRAMGTLPAGTLLWATSAGTESSGISLRIWRSGDAGVTWAFHSTISTSTAGLWEPEFDIDTQGRLVVYFSSEAYKASGYNQAIVQAFSTDGAKTWTAPQIIVGVADGVRRPGMPVVTKTPAGRYLMTYEICNWDYGCVVHVRGSHDGYTWGPPDWLGYRPTSTNGNVFAHAPTITWVNDGTANGRVLLIGQRLYDKAGRVVAGNGGTIFSSPTGGEFEPWTEINAPVQIPETATRLNWCNNYSTPLVTTRDGRGIISIALGDNGVNNACRAYYGVNWLASGRCVILGAISDKYNEKYGSLGFCQSGEFATADTVGRYNRFERGSIYWHPNTQAHEVHGLIHAKWAAKGYERSLVGFPVTDEVALPNGTGAYNHFERGSIYWKAGTTQAFMVVGLIKDKWAEKGYETGPLGFPIQDDAPAADGVGAFSNFENGTIFWKPNLGAHEIHGVIYAKWARQGYERAILGYPTTDQVALPNGAYNHFEFGSIYWKAGTPEAFYVVHGIRDKWAAHGWEAGRLGYPKTDDTRTPDGVGAFNHFEGGSIYWKSGLGVAAVFGAIRDKWASLGYERSSLGYPVRDEYAVTGGRESEFERGYITLNTSTGALTVRMK